MSEECKRAWSCFTGSTLHECVQETALIARCWLQSHIQTWTKACDVATKRAGLRNSKGELIDIVVYSESPLKEFAECSFRVKEDAFKPSETWNQDEAPEEYKILAVLASLIYEINKCSVTLSDMHCIECCKQMEVCLSYTKHVEAYSSIVDALPTNRISERMKEIETKTEAKANDEKNVEMYKANVQNMKNLDNFRSVLVTLISAAKTNQATLQIQTMSQALSEFNYKQLEAGKF